MVNFKSDEEKYNNSEVKVELELQELEKEFNRFPLHPKVLSSELDSELDKDSSLESIKGDKYTTNAPLFLTSPFPPPPQFCSGLSEANIRLLHSNNVKIKLVLAVSTISIICTCIGVFALFFYHANRATNPSSSDNPDFDTLESKTELNLQVLVNLSETLSSLTGVPKFSTISITFTVDDSWAEIQSYECD